MSGSILLVEDDTSSRELAVYNLAHAGYAVIPARDGQQGLEALESAEVDLIITDVKMPGITGIELLRVVSRTRPGLPVIVVTAYADVELAVEAMKLGAADFLGKPFSRDHLLVVVERALARHRMERELTHLRVASTGVERPIIHASGAMARLLEMADRFAASEASVLICGPNGTGKELLARRVHARSPRALGPFVPVNLAAVPETLLESELFGHVKGAFTGAAANRQGKFRQAQGGTIFLDEISELPVGLQSKLLRALQEKTVDPVGSDRTETADARVVAATNRDIEAEVRAGRFREDLYYRINVVQLEVPPLGERFEDLEPLARHFIDRYADGRSLHLPDEVLDALRRHPWNGNVRELENVCQRLVLLAPEGAVRVEDLPFGGEPDDASRGDGGALIPAALPEGGLSLFDVEKQVIERALAYKGGNVSQAAVYLRVPRHVLAYRMEKYGLSKKGG